MSSRVHTHVDLDGNCQHVLQEQGIAKIKQAECTFTHEHCGF